MSLISRLLLMAAWVGVSLLVFCLYMIARFYQQKSGQRSYYGLFLIPLALYLAGAFYCTLPGHDFALTPIADALFLLAAIGTLALGSYLFSLMTGGKR